MPDKYYDDDEETMVLSDLIRYADHNKSFNRDFVDSVYDFYDETGFITEKQLIALQWIYKSQSVEEFLK